MHFDLDTIKKARNELDGALNFQIGLRKSTKLSLSSFSWRSFKPSLNVDNNCIPFELLQL